MSAADSCAGVEIEDAGFQGRVTPCLVCGSALEPVSPECENQPHYATVFSARGQYGSTVFDPMDGSYLELNVCDRCLLEAAARGQVLWGRDGARRSEGGSCIGIEDLPESYPLISWKPGIG
jgi:hypothetical protein